MTIPALMSKLLSFLTLQSLIKKYRRKSSLIKIKAVKVYVLGIKKIRLFFMAVIFVLLSFVLLGSGLSLVHTAVLSYSNWDAQMRFTVALLLGGAEALVAAGILFYLFREETWVRFSGIQKLVNSVIEKEAETSE